ncbi:transposase [Latilactobacillus fuchuensis]
MDTAIRTLKKNLNGIQNAMLHPCSNGPIEGLNHKIKTLKRNLLRLPQ